jgi:hypothetical protein
MSRRRLASAKSEASEAELWDLTPEELKSYEKANQITAKAEEARWRLQKDRIITWGAVILLAATFAACLAVVVIQRA